MKLKRQWIIKGININQGTEFVQGVFDDYVEMAKYVEAIGTEQLKYFDFWVELRECVVPSEK